MDVLAAADSPVWGKQIIHLTELQSGSVYPALARLERARWVESYWEKPGAGLGRPARHYYKITKKGRFRLKDEIERLEAISGQISQAGPPELGIELPSRFAPGTSVPFRPAILPAGLRSGARTDTVEDVPPGGPESGGNVGGPHGAG